MRVLDTRRIDVDGFGFLNDGDTREIVRRYTMTNKNNASVKLISLGGGIQSVIVPNKNYDFADVVLGFDNLSDYLKNRYIGRIVGRVAKPFKRKLRNDKEVEDEDGKAPSFDIVNWDSYILGDRVVMTHVSRDGSAGYPGDLFTQVNYSWTDDNRLHIDITATTTKPTPVNITNQCLFNLAGHSMGPQELKKHVVTINTTEHVEMDLVKKIPTGIVKKNYGTIFELRKPTLLNTKILFKVPGGGYNHNFLIDNPTSDWFYRFHARMSYPPNGRILEVYSNHPTLQFYTGNDLPDFDRMRTILLESNESYSCEGKLTGKDGLSYQRHGCFGLIPQGYPKTLDCKKSSSNILHPGKIYVHNITYDFGCFT